MAFYCCHVFVGAVQVTSVVLMFSCPGSLFTSCSGTPMKPGQKDGGGYSHSFSVGLYRCSLFVVRWALPLIQKCLQAVALRFFSNKKTEIPERCNSRMYTCPENRENLPVGCIVRRKYDGKSNSPHLKTKPFYRKKTYFIVFFCFANPPRSTNPRLRSTKPPIRTKDLKSRFPAVHICTNKPPKGTAERWNWKRRWERGQNL